MENINPNILAPKELVTHTSKWVLDACNLKSNAHINVILVDDAKITELNITYFRKHEPTDVISFNLSDNEDIYLEGEVYISLDRTAQQAKEFGIPFEEELIRLTTHGVLHLLGYRDDSKENKRVMSSYEDDAIKAMARYIPNLQHSF